MGRLSTAILTAVATTALSACQTSPTSEYSVPGVRHTEPVQFNDERYNVTFEYSNTLAGYDIQVHRPGQPLGDGARDRDDSVQVAQSAITHFACPNGQRARVVDGSPAYSDAKTWSLQAKCS